MASNDAQPIQTENTNVAIMALAWEMTKFAAYYVEDGIAGPEAIQALYAQNLAAIQKAWNDRDGDEQTRVRTVRR